MNKTNNFTQLELKYFFLELWCDGCVNDNLDDIPRCSFQINILEKSKINKLKCDKYQRKYIRK